MAGRGVPKEGMQQQQGEGVPDPPRESLTPLETQEEDECRICYNPFDGVVHLPKLLECLHTFCLQCLRQMHLRSAARSWPGVGATIRCPLCNHRTALPGEGARSLPDNTKRLRACLLQPQLDGDPVGDAPQLPLPATGSRESSPLQQLQQQQPSSDPCCCPSWRKILGCLCLVLALLLLAAAWLHWVPLHIFLPVALGLIFCSTLPFLVFYFKFSRGPRTIFLRRTRTPIG